MLLLLCAVCVLYGSVCFMAIIRRVSIGVTGARRAVCAWGMLCGVRVARLHAPRTPEYYYGGP